MRFTKQQLRNGVIVIGLIGVLSGAAWIRYAPDILPTLTRLTNSTYHATAYTPEQVHDMLKHHPDKYVVLDVRTKIEYDKGHLPGAVHADYHDTEALKKAAGNKTPITYCTFSAMRGPYAAYQLYQAGYSQTAVLDGGVSAWAEDTQGLDSDDPLSKEIFKHPKNIFPVRKPGKYPADQGSVEYTITAQQFDFTPNLIVAKHGQRVTLHLLSLDVTHGFSLPEYGIETELLPHEPVTVTFIADRKGNFPFVCSVICGHNHPSMVGNLIVQ